MKFQRSVYAVFAVCLMLAAATCTPVSGERSLESTLTVKVLFVGRQCQPASTGWRAAWISSPEDLDRLVTRCRGTRIGILPAEVPVVDFDGFGVLAVEMGQQRSAGYGFDTEGVTAAIENKTATVTLPYRTPAPGAFTAQVMTSPWILLQLPLDAYDEIRVVDQDARLLTQIQL